MPDPLRYCDTCGVTTGQRVQCPHCGNSTRVLGQPKPSHSKESADA